MLRYLVLVSFPFFFFSCGSGSFFSGVWKSVKRFLVPTSCRIEVKLDTQGLEYVDDLWDYQFSLSESTELSEFADAVSFSPKVSLNADYGSWSATGFSLNYWKIQPETEYKILVNSFYSDNDCYFSSPVEFSLPKLKVKPNFYLTRENIFESDLNKVLPVSIHNIKEMDIRSGEISTSALVGAISSLGSRYYESKNLINWKSTQWNPGKKVNVFYNQGMDIDSYFGPKPNAKGWLALELGANVIGDQNKEIYKKESIFLQSTNLGITTKSDSQNLYVWVHTLSKAEPVANVVITLYERGIQRGECTSNKDGQCVLPSISDASSFDKSVLIATHEPTKDKAFLHFSETQIEGYGYYSSTNEIRGKVYFDRKLYRPKDKVEIKAFLGERKSNGLVPYSGKAVTVKIRDSQGKEFYTQSLTTSLQGGLATNVTISEESPLGHYTVLIFPSGYSNSITYETFQVEEFRPVNFMVETKLPTSIQKGESLKGKIEGRYLFGAPMGGAKVSYSLLKRQRGVYFEDYPEYSFVDSWYDYTDEYGGGNSEFVSGSEGKLGTDGTYSVDIPIKDLNSYFATDGDKIEITSPKTLVLESSVYDVDGKSVTKTTNVSYSPSDNFVGIKAKERYQTLDKTFQFHFITLNKEGKLKPGTDLEVYVIYNDWTSVLSKGLGKFFFRSNQVQKKIIQTKSLKTANAPIPFDIKVSDPGSYTLLVLNADKQFSRVDFYAYEKESYYTWDFRGDDSIELKTDKKEYNIGDKAKILIKSPLQNARAIVSIERDQVYSTKTFFLKGNSAPIEIPIEAGYLPNVEVSVILLSGRTSLPEGLSSEDIKMFNEQDLGAPKAKTGSVTLNVNLNSKTSSVSIQTDKEEYQPGEKVKLTLVSDPGAELVVSVADRGVLDLVGYQFQNPLHLFYQGWYSLVRTFELRSMIVRHYLYENKGDSPGGDYGEESGGGFGAESESGARKDFKYTAYWNPSVVTNSSGVAELSFTLPDNLTTFRVMVASSSNGKYGATNKEFTVKKNLVLQKTVARFIRIGDKLELGGSITNNTKKKSTFRYKFDSNFLSGKSDWQSIELLAGQTKEVVKTFLLSEADYVKRKKEKPKDPIALNFRLSVEPQRMEDFPEYKKSDLSDALFVEIPVREFDPITSYSLAGFTDSEFKTTISLPKKENILLNQGSLNIRLSATALTGLKNAFDFYETNPYFCLEQRASAYILSLSAGELLKEFEYKVPAGEYYDFRNIEKIFIDEVGNFQMSDGSFRLWKSGHGRHGYPYLTAYVVSALQLGKLRGKRVDVNALNSGIQFLKNYIQNPSETKSDSWQTLSLIYEVLSRDGQNVTSLEKSILDNFSLLNLKSKGIFLLTYAKNHNLADLQSDPIFAKKFGDYNSKFLWEKDILKVELDTNASYFYSYYNSASALSFYLRLLTTLDSSNPKIVKLVREILTSKKENYWMDSHSVANLAIALSDYRNTFEATESDTSVSASLGGNLLVSQSFSPRSDSFFKTDISLESLFSNQNISSQPLFVKRESDVGRAYFQARLQYYPLKDTLVEKSEGLKLEKTIYKIEGRDSSGNPILKETKSLERGFTYLIKNTILSSEDRAFLMVVDPIPSSAEVVNANFLTEKNSDAEDTAVDPGNNWFYGGTVEYRDDRVLFSEDYVSKGKTEFRYILRPVAKGDTILPATRAFLMYRPQIFGNTNTIRIKSE